MIRRSVSTKQVIHERPLLEQLISCMFGFSVAILLCFGAAPADTEISFMRRAAHMHGSSAPAYSDKRIWGIRTATHALVLTSATIPPNRQPGASIPMSMVVP
jgi:hypothetical protein